MMHLTVDLDNLWIYESEFNSTEQGPYDLLFTEAMPRMLRIFEELGARATLFVVGRDLERPSCQEFCREAVKRGHEIANHSYSHPTNFPRLSFAEKEAEILRCHELISKHTGVEPIGFRGPGYYLDQDMIKILLNAGYCYDSSVLPGLANQMMKLYMKIRGEKPNDKVFGRNRWMFASQNVTKISHPQVPGRVLYELPITTAPFLRWPIHTTFLYMFGTGYLRIFLPLLRSLEHGTYVFHAIDTLEYKNDQRLSNVVLPLMKSLESRVELMRWLLRSFRQDRFTTMRECVALLTEHSTPRSLLLNSAQPNH